MFLEKLGPPEPTEPLERAARSATTGRQPGDDLPALRVVGAINLAQSIRRYGHLAARIDPLGTEPIGDPLLEVSTHQITESDLRALPPTLVDSALTSGASSMADVIDRLREVYCSTTGYDVAHIFVPRNAAGFAARRRAGASARPRIRSTRWRCSTGLTQVEAFEKFIHRSFPGKTRFSIEGLDMLVPILDEVIRKPPRPACARRSSAWRIADA
jgi:2-oxoglutarate dehydrogenase E1 component